MTRYATPFGAYEIDSIPGQPQIAHCHSLFVLPEHRRQGLGHLLKQNQNETLAQLGYDFATCTVASGNAAQKRVLAKAGWSELASFNNNRTAEQTEVWGYQVRRAA